MRILGLSGTYHDAAAALIADGVIAAAAQEERFSRIKADRRLPEAAVRWALDAHPGAIDHVAFYDKPLLTFHRVIETALAVAPRGLGVFLRSMPAMLGEKLWTEPDIRAMLRRCGVSVPQIWFPEHHESHAASAFYPSPFDRAAVLTVDGVGEWATATIGLGEGTDLQLVDQLDFPHSLGLLYAAVTEHCGFRVNSGEYKLMGLAPFGEPRFVADLYELIDLRDDGSFQLDLRWFSYLDGDRTAGAQFTERFGPARAPESKFTQRDLDLARSVQVITEEVVLRMARHAIRRTGARNLCLAGGVALNAVANGRLVRERVADAVWIQPAAGDAGGALGAALAIYHGELGHPRIPGDRMRGARLGPAFASDDIAAWLDAERIPYERRADGVADAIADAIAAGRVVGRLAGAMEWGPRALGGRSILADPRRRDIHSLVNQKIKFREGFRPFAPVVPVEHAAEWFDLDVPSPYMLLVAPVRQRPSAPVAAHPPDPLDLLARVRAVDSAIPAVTHVDGSARVQTLARGDDPVLHEVLTTFGARTGCPVLLNTSFNVRGEPIVCTPEDAFDAFLRTDLDDLFLEDLHLRKADQSAARIAAARARVFAPD